MPNIKVELRDTLNQFKTENPKKSQVQNLSTRSSWNQQQMNLLISFSSSPWNLALRETLVVPIYIGVICQESLYWPQSSLHIWSIWQFTAASCNALNNMAFCVITSMTLERNTLARPSFYPDPRDQIINSQEGAGRSYTAWFCQSFWHRPLYKTIIPNGLLLGKEQDKKWMESFLGLWSQQSILHLRNHLVFSIYHTWSRTSYGRVKKHKKT